MGTPPATSLDLWSAGTLTGSLFGVERWLPAEEFLRRFLLHVLPHRFVRIRYYGLLANRHRDRQLERCRALLHAASPTKAAQEREDWLTLYQRVTGQDPTLCAECRHGHLRRIRKLPALARRPPP